MKADTGERTDEELEWGQICGACPRCDDMPCRGCQDGDECWGSDCHCFGEGPDDSGPDGSCLCDDCRGYEDDDLDEGGYGESSLHHQDDDCDCEDCEEQREFAPKYLTYGPDEDDDGG